MSIVDAFAERRSIYALKNSSPISDREITELVRSTLRVLPSAFNSQPVRTLVLVGNSHTQLWALTQEALRAKVPADKMAPVEAKLAMFAAAHGTLLWFRDNAVTDALIKQFPSYAAHFPTWAEHAEGIAQFAVWCALRERGLGANLQHYNPLIDAAVRKAFAVPASWCLVAEMPFGEIARIDPVKPRLPDEQVVQVR